MNKILRKFAADPGDLDGLEQILLIDPRGWREILESSIQSWPDCSALIRTYAKLKHFEDQFPETIRDSSESIEQAGLWSQVNQELGSAYNRAGFQEEEAFKRDLELLQENFSHVQAIALNMDSLAVKLGIHNGNSTRLGH